MKRLTLISVTSLFLMAFMVQNIHAVKLPFDKREVGFFVMGRQTLYAPTNLTLIGRDFCLEVRNDSHLVKIRTGSTQKNAHDIEAFGRNHFGFDVERLVWKFVVAKVAYEYENERYKLHLFQEPLAAVMIEKWQRTQITAGLGAILGNYSKSFVRFAALMGYSGYSNKDALTFLGTNIDKEIAKELMLGAHIKARYDVVNFFWLHFEGMYAYFNKRKNNRYEVAAGFGVKPIKFLGAKFTWIMIKQDDAFKDKFRFGAVIGLVVLF